MNPHFLTLSTGRRLAYDLYGDPQGVPAFYFHGWPSSRVQGALMDQVGLDLGLCIAAMDRPGIGQSDVQPGRRLQDWPAVLAELADHLGWDTFHLFGVSGGGPYVLVTAHAMPGRVISATVICGAPPLRWLGTRDLFWPYRLALLLRRWVPWLLAPAFGMARLGAFIPWNRAPLNLLLYLLSPRDRRSLMTGNTLPVVAGSFRECIASGIPNVQKDGDIYLEDWGFDLKDISIPVHVWHGRRDRNIPWTYAQKVAAAIPLAIAHWTEDDGHYSLPVLRAREIAEVAQGRPAA